MHVLGGDTGRSTQDFLEAFDRFRRGPITLFDRRIERLKREHVDAFEPRLDQDVDLGTAQDGLCFAADCCRSH